MYQQVVANGYTPTAINTDCIFFNSKEPVKENEIDSSLFQNIGKYKWRSIGETQVPKKPFNDKTVNPKLKLTDLLDNISNPPQPTMQTIEKKHFWKTKPGLYENEAYDKLDENKYNLIHGLQAGSGKTYLATSYLKHLAFTEGFNYLAIAPSNKRVIELRNTLGQDKATTLHQLLNLRIEEDDVVSTGVVKRSALHDLDILFIDEIYAFDVNSLSQIKSSIMDRFPDLRVVAAGDVIQSRVSDIKVTDIDSYYLSVVATVFPTGISLSINKRMDNPDEQQKIEEIKTTIFKNKSKAIPHVGSTNSTAELYDRHFTSNGQFQGKIVAYHLDTCDTVGKLIHSEFMKRNPRKKIFKIHGMHLFKGQELINRDHRKLAGKTLYVNYSYIVDKFEERKCEVRIDKNGRRDAVI